VDARPRAATYIRRRPTVDGVDSGHIGNHSGGNPIGTAYADHLTEADLRLLASASGTPVTPDELRHSPSAALPLLDRPAVYDALLGAEAREAGLVVGVSPFLVFAVAVHRFAADLTRQSEQRQAPGRAGPPDLEQRDFLGSLARRLFLAELLTSFTTPGEQYPVRPEGPARRASGLDPTDLTRVLDEVPKTDRPGVYRRLGDVALFLAGVFPDQARRVFGQVQPEALLPVIGPARPEQRSDVTPAISLLERLGSRWYRTAYELAPVRSTRLAVVAEVADRFTVARTVLDQVARRHLLPTGLPWFRPPHR
jgi:hypothetical protein